MICPTTKRNCDCLGPMCCYTGCDKAVTLAPSVEPSVSGMAMMANCAPSREYAAARMAEISITADEFAAMVKDAERWRKFCSLDADVYINSTGEVFAGEGFCQVLAQYLDAMESNKGEVK